LSTTVLRIPRRDAQHHAGRLPHRHRQAARHVGGDHLAADLGRQRSRLEQHAGGQVDVEARPHGGGAGLGRHRVGKGRALGLERDGGLEQQPAAFARAHRGPGRKGGGSSLHGGDLRDPALSIDGIAQALRCSKRHLHNAFAGDEETLTGYILQQRLACSIRELLDPANAARPITDIALASGFSNLSHFSRVFREHTGGSPSDFRRQAAGR
jgi:AraC-like DNA-binding protein